MNPICLVISFVGALTASAGLCGIKKTLRNLGYMLPMILFALLINPVFNHEGATILAYLPGGNPLTLESIIYGMAAGLMLAAVLCHFSCFNKVMTSDKLVYLFGRISPALSLVFSMSLRMVPMFIEQTKQVSAAQRCIGRDTKTGSLTDRIGNAVSIMSVMITWSLENAVTAADSMKSRGYGLKGRTAFSLFRFDKRDAAVLAVVLALGVTLLYGNVNGMMYWRCFPTMKWGGGSAALPMYIVYVMLVMVCPVINFINERRRRG